METERCSRCNMVADSLRRAAARIEEVRDDARRQRAVKRILRGEVGQLKELYGNATLALRQATRDLAAAREERDGYALALEQIRGSADWMSRHADKALARGGDDE